MEGGYELTWRYATHNVANTDGYGEMVIEQFFKGIADVFIQFTCKEWTTATLNAATRWDAMSATGADYFGPGTVGRAGSDVAKTLVLNATAATPAAATPASLTILYALIAESFDVRMLMDSRLRRLPVKLRILPYSDASVVKFFTTT